MFLFFLRELPASAEKPPCFVKKNCKTYQPEGRQAKCVKRPANYEAASGLNEIQRQLGRKSTPRLIR